MTQPNSTNPSSISLVVQSWPKLRLSHISYALLALSAVTWLYSVGLSSFRPDAVGGTGLLSILHPGVFLSWTILVGVIAIGSITGDRSSVLLWAKIILAIVILWATPLLVGASYPALRNSHIFYGMTDFIQREGRLAPDILWYHAWPSAWILLAEIIELLGLNDPWPLLRLSPLLFQFVLLPILVFCLRESLGHTQSAVIGPAIILFYLANWVGVAAWQPSALGIALLMVAFGWLFFLVRKPHESESLGILGLILALALTFSHFLSVGVFVAVVAAILLFRRRGTWAFLSLVVISVSTWAVYWGHDFVAARASFLSDRILDIRLLFQLGFSDRLQGMANQVHRWVNVVKVVTSGLFVALAIAGILKVFFSKRGSEGDRVSVTGLIGILCFVVLMGASYLWELPDRVFLFSLPFMIHFIARLQETSNLKVLLLPVIWICFPLFFISTHGNAIVDYYSPQAQRAVVFFQRATTMGSLLSMSPAGFVKYAERYRVVVTQDLFPKKASATAISTLGEYLSGALGDPCYVEIGHFEKRLVTFKYGDARFIDALREQVEGLAGRLYDNGDVRFYDCHNTHIDLRD